MIDQFDVKQALRAQGEVAAAAVGFEYIRDDDKKTLDVNTSYLVESFIPTRVFAFGTADNSSDYQNSLFQLDVRTPKTAGTNLTQLRAEQIKDYFTRGTVLQKNGQKLRVKTVDQTSVQPNDTHYIIFLTINYFVSG